MLGPRGNNSLVMNRRGSNSSALSSMSSGEKAVMQSINAGVASLSVDDNEAPPTQPGVYHLNADGKWRKKNESGDGSGARSINSES